MRSALGVHDEILRRAIDAHSGYLFSSMGDGVAAAFDRAADGVAAAVDAQRGLAAVAWPRGVEMRVRMGLHTGDAVEQDGDYFGGSVNRAARLMAAGQGGQVVVSEVTAALVAGTHGIWLIDLGLHRLRGLVGSTRVFGVEAEGLKWVDRPLATEEARRGNLPRPATEWFGPVGQLKQWVAELGRRRLMTLTGPGGVGKTRAAIEIGAMAADDYPDGVWMVELAPVGDPEAVPAAVATALGVLSQGGLSMVDAVTAWLEGRRVLLIVDNCEHVLDAAAELIGKVVAACEKVTVLATSRERLGVAGEQVAPVVSLGRPDAVDLFRDRAGLADMSFEVAGPEQEIVADVCARLDGIPLAIELAAARVRSMTPAELLARLDDRFKVLRSGQRGEVGRHRTLQATVDWSYQLLSGQERLLFDRLSVFAGDFDLAAVEAVCADNDLDRADVFDLIDGLVTKSLVVAEQGSSVTRFRLLETLRQFGEVRLGERGESAGLRQGHLDHYVGVAERAYRLWASPRQQDGMQIFSCEWDNLRAAHAAALDSADDDKAECLLTATWPYAFLAGRVEHLGWSQRTIDLCRRIGRLRPLVFGFGAAIAWVAGDNERALMLSTEGIASVSDPNDRDIFLCWAALAHASVYTGQIDGATAAVAPLTAILDASTDEFDALWIAITLLHVAIVTKSAAARGHLERVRRAAMAVGAPALLALQMHWEGNMLMADSHPDVAGAAEWFGRSLAMARVLEAPVLVSYNMARQLRLVDALEGDQADQACRDAITAGYELGMGNQLAISMTATACHLDSRGNSEAAGLIVGYLEANHAGFINTPMIQQTGTGRTLQQISADSAPAWKAKGAAMSRTEWVDYTLNALPSR
jgi:predicted ATPase